MVVVVVVVAVAAGAGSLMLSDRTSAEVGSGATVNKSRLKYQCVTGSAEERKRNNLRRKNWVKKIRQHGVNMCCEPNTILQTSSPHFEPHCFGLIVKHQLGR